MGGWVRGAACQYQLHSKLLIPYLDASLGDCFIFNNVKHEIDFLFTHSHNRNSISKHMFFKRKVFFNLMTFSREAAGTCSRPRCKHTQEISMSNPMSASN